MPTSLDPTTLLTTVLEGIGQPFYAVDSEWHITHYNSHAARHFGRPATEMIGVRIWDIFGDDIENERGRLLFGAMAHHETRTGEILSRTGRHVGYTIFPLGGGLGILFRDITQRRKTEAEREQAEEALRKRSAELEAVLETIPTAVWFTHDPKGRSSVCNRRASELLRLPQHTRNSRQMPYGVGYRYCRHGVEVPVELLPLQRAARGEEVPSELLELVFDNGERRILLMRAATLRDTNGEPQGGVCAAVDVTERQGYEDHLQRLVHEFGHRMRNLLATVQSLALESLQDTKDIGQARQALEGRLQALVRAQETLTADRWEGASLRAVIEKATAPFHDPRAPRLALEGPDLRVPPKVALALSLGLYELSTNAQKYGALSSPAGRIDVTWSAKPDVAGQQLTLEWREHDGPAVAEPARRGFGARMVEQGLAHELAGEVTLAFEPQGVRCLITATVGELP